MVTVLCNEIFSVAIHVQFHSENYAVQTHFSIKSGAHTAHACTGAHTAL